MRYSTFTRLYELRTNYTCPVVISIFRNYLNTSPRFRIGFRCLFRMEIYRLRSPNTKVKTARTDSVGYDKKNEPETFKIFKNCGYLFKSSRLFFYEGIIYLFTFFVCIKYIVQLPANVGRRKNYKHAVQYNHGSRGQLSVFDHNLVFFFHPTFYRFFIFVNCYFKRSNNERTVQTTQKRLKLSNEESLSL